MQGEGTSSRRAEVGLTPHDVKSHHMPGHTKILNQRQLAFAQAIAAGGMSLHDAALRAGYSDSSRTTSVRLMKMPIVKAEIERLTTLARASVRIDAETWNRELVYQYQKYRDEDGALALRALESWARSLGLFDTKAESGSVELASRLLALLAQAGRPQLIEGSGVLVDGAPIEPKRD